MSSLDEELKKDLLSEFAALQRSLRITTIYVTHSPWSGVLDQQRGRRMNTRSIRFRMTVWYSGLLAVLLILFGVASYVGLRHYLRHNMTESLVGQAQQIAGLLENADVSGDKYVTDEIEEHLAPEPRSRVESIEGQGSMFTVRLPLAEV
jgi:hypothetical protein